MYSLIVLVLIVIISCCLIFYYYKRTVNYSLEKVISYPNNLIDYNLGILWNEKPTEYKINQLICHDSNFSYLKEYLENMNFDKNGYLISNGRKITSVYWSPHLADRFYKRYPYRWRPVCVEYDTVLSNNIYVYKIKRNKYRNMAPE